jgi:hypothetical protein
MKESELKVCDQALEEKRSNSAKYGVIRLMAATLFPGAALVTAGSRKSA